MTLAPDNDLPRCLLDLAERDQYTLERGRPVPEFEGVCQLHRMFGAIQDYIAPERNQTRFCRIRGGHVERKHISIGTVRMLDDTRRSIAAGRLLESVNHGYRMPT
jgi:hypothetical protein